MYFVLIWLRFVVISPLLLKSASIQHRCRMDILNLLSYGQCLCCSKSIGRKRNWFNLLLSRTSILRSSNRLCHSPPSILHNIIAFYMITQYFFQRYCSSFLKGLRARCDCFVSFFLLFINETHKTNIFQCKKWHWAFFISRKLDCFGIAALFAVESTFSADREMTRSTTIFGQWFIQENPILFLFMRYNACIFRTLM